MYDAYKIILLYKNLYFGLFNAITNALRLLEAQNVSEAKKVLMAAQCKAEELYMSAGEVDGDISHFPPPMEDMPGLE